MSKSSQKGGKKSASISASQVAAEQGIAAYYESQFALANSRGNRNRTKEYEAAERNIAWLNGTRTLAPKPPK